MTDFGHIAADQMDQALFEALWSALDHQPLGSVSLEKLANEAGMALTDVYVRYSDSNACLLYTSDAADE